MNEYIKKHKVTLLMLLIVMLLVSCLIIPAYAYDLGGGLYCGTNLLNPYSLFHKDNGAVVEDGRNYTFTTNGNSESFIKIQIRNGFNLIYYIDLFKGEGFYTYPFNFASNANVLTFGISGNATESLILFNFEYPAGTYFLRFNVNKLSPNELHVSDIMVTAKPYDGDFEPYFQNYSGNVYPLNFINKTSNYTAMIGYYALPRPLPSNINVSFFVEGIDKFSFNEDEYPRFNIGYTNVASLDYVFSSDFVCDAEFYTEIPLSSLATRVINDQLINDFQCFDITYIVLDFMSGNTSDVERVQRALVNGDIKGYIRVNSVNADYSGAYSEGYGAGLNDGSIIKQNDSLAIFPSFFGAIADFFKKFLSIEVFGITLGTVAATLISIIVAVSVYKMLR